MCDESVVTDDVSTSWAPSGVTDPALGRIPDITWIRDPVSPASEWTSPVDGSHSCRYCLRHGCFDRTLGAML